MYLHLQGFQKLQQCCVDHYERLAPSNSQRVSIGHRVLHHTDVVSKRKKKREKRLRLSASI